jgi:hypothetical protein
MFALPLSAGDVVVLGGREFDVIDFDRRTVRQDHYLQRQIQDAGLDKVLPMDDDEGDAAYLVRMHSALIRSGRAPEIIACYLLPRGLPNAEWSVDVAKATAAHIGALDTEADRELVHRLALEAVFGFFRQGLERLKRSLERFEPASESTQARATH